jgi:hypothetical protein
VVLGIAGYWYVTQQQEKQRAALLERKQAQEAEVARAQREADARREAEAEARRTALEEQRRKQEEQAALKAADERRQMEEARRQQAALEAQKAAEERRKREEQAALKAADERRRMEAESAKAAAERETATSRVELQRRAAAEAGWPPEVVRCFAYDPATLRVTSLGDRGWAVYSGNYRVAIADTPSDADAIVRVAKGYTLKCLVGLDGKAPGGRQWRFVFWERPTGVSIDARGEDCLRYDSRRLEIRDEGAAGWLLTDGASRVGLLNNEADARVALRVAKRGTLHCFVGRENKRADRSDYITPYWKR